MTECAFCALSFPEDDDMYLDIYGVCHAQPCQERKCRLVLKGKWFDSETEKAFFVENHETDPEEDAWQYLIDVQLEEWGMKGETNSVPVIRAMRHIKDELERYAD